MEELHVKIILYPQLEEGEVNPINSSSSTYNILNLCVKCYMSTPLALRSVFSFSTSHFHCQAERRQEANSRIL